jgi:tetratricopeptide (TPR) repeat protein
VNKRSSPRARLLGLVPALVAAVGCGAHSQKLGANPPLTELRKDAPKTDDPEEAGIWLLEEMIGAGGDAARAKVARARLDALGGHGMFASLGRGVDDALHGRLAQASDHYLEAVSAARDSLDPRAPIVAWFSANRAVSLGRQSPDLWKRWKPFVEDALRAPRAIGWRARSELVEWAIDQASAEGDGDVDERTVALYGCLTSARMAGPFGRGAPSDAVRAFPPEASTPWPYRWDPEPGAARAARLLATVHHSCAIEADENVGDGIFYAETFFDLPDAADVLVAVQGALALRVDGEVVLDRDVRRWGIWPRFGVEVRLSAGRHRIVARLGEPSTSIRLMRPDGTPLGVAGSSDPRPPGVTTPPSIAGEPNVLVKWVHDGRLIDPGDDVTRYLAAFLAHVDSSDDVASVFLSPLLEKVDLATGPTLSLAALYAGGDPIFDSSQATDLVRELHERAAKKDAGLWSSRLSLALGLAERKGAEEAVPELERLASEFPGVPEIVLSLARVYGELGWTSEHSRALKTLVQRFPNDMAALHAALDVYDQEGDARTADALLERMQKLDRDDETLFTRALAREDYDTAIRELERLAKLHPERKELADSIFDAKVRAGKDADVLSKLEAAVKKEPTNANARLDLADARYAKGDEHALYRALAEGVEAGASSPLLVNSIDLVEGMTELEPYRLDAMQIIDAFEKSGKEMPGTAARVLDYSALWVRADGSSRMLEHEIVRIQSAEAISTFAEHRALEGLPLHMRVIKKDRTTFEPEAVPGKSTVTFPHLEVGDYIETEQVVFSPGDGKGVQYLGPRWFFREENVSYARSEFVVIAPESKALVVETTGNVPAPIVERHDGLVTRRFRVDYSPAAPVEPASVPITEFLPSVRLGWGVTLDRRLVAMSDALEQMTPVDPRIVSIAEHVVSGVPKNDALGRAKRLYRWLLDNVEPGDESDGRRVVIGKRGNLWQGFRALCRAENVPLRYAVARSRLAPPPDGPLSSSMLFTQPLAKIEAPNGSAWLTLGNKYAPFGYVPADVRGMPAHFLDDTAHTRTTVPEQGGADGIAFSGRGRLTEKGELDIDLVEEFSGRLAIQLRRGLSQVAEHELHDVLESNLLAQTLRGGELVKFSIERRDDLDAPLVIRMTVKVSRFAQANGKALVFSPPLAPDLGRLATLPTRETPLLIGESLHRRIALELELPRNAAVSGTSKSTLSDGDRRIVIEDATRGNVLALSRSIDIPAGRVRPEDYPSFARFARQSDDALSRAIEVRLP